MMIRPRPRSPATARNGTQGAGGGDEAGCDIDPRISVAAQSLQDFRLIESRSRQSCGISLGVRQGKTMGEGEVVYLAWSDYVGITRCRGIPATDVAKRMEYGLGWAVA